MGSSLHIRQRGVRSTDLPPSWRISPTRTTPHGFGGYPRNPVIDEERNGRATIDAIVYERTPAECEG